MLYESLIVFFDRHGYRFEYPGFFAKRMGDYDVAIGTVYAMRETMQQEFSVQINTHDGEFVDGADATSAMDAVAKAVQLINDRSE